MRILNDIANILRDYPEEEVVVAGYAGEGMDTKEGRELSRKRAEAVKDYYVYTENLPEQNFKTKVVAPMGMDGLFTGVIKRGSSVDTILTAEKTSIDSISSKKLARLKAHPAVAVSRSYAGKRTKITATEKAIHFEFDSAEVKKQHFKTLDKIAGLIKAETEYSITIRGHTDNVGKIAYNMELSINRAKSVLNYFTKKHGILKENCEYRGYGETRPVVTNETLEGMAKNRRVEILINRKDHEK